MATVTFEDQLLALERKVLRDAGGDFFAVVDELRTLLAMQAPGIERRLLSLAIPRMEEAARRGVEVAYGMGAYRALEAIRPQVDEIVERRAEQAVDTVPPSLQDPFDGLDALVEAAIGTAGLLIASGAAASVAAAMVFGAATTAKARIETQINAASNTATRTVGDAAKYRMVWVAERDACVYCLGLSGEVVGTGETFPDADLYAPQPSSYRAILEPPRHPHCRCQLEVLVDLEYAEALKREAQRSVLRGFSLRSESNKVRVEAARRLLARDPDAPKSVKEYARRAVKAGAFPRGRDVPEGDPRLVID